MLYKSIYYTDDLDRTPIDSSKVKRVAAAEKMSCRCLYSNPIVVRPTGKIMWTTNFFPNAPGDDHAYWERFVLIEFLTKYLPDLSKVDPEKYVFLQNEAAAEALLEKLDAFFTVTVRALHEYYRTLPFDAERGGPSVLCPFPIPEAARKATEEARKQQFPLLSFISEYTAETAFPGEYVRIDQLFPSYLQHLENLNESKLKRDTTQTAFVRLLASSLEIPCSGEYVHRKLTKPIVAVREKGHWVSDTHLRYDSHLPLNV